MEIAPINTQNAAPANTSQASAVLSSDFETFLKMLTAQAQYQDPLEPIDSSEYAAQLAQFSMVEQQVLSNDLLSQLVTQLGAGNITQVSGWIGREALTTAGTSFDGTPIELLPKPTVGADQMVLIARDSAGAEVQRIALPISSDPISWAGVTSDGTPFPSGQYRFEIESRANGQVIATTPAETYARITEVRLRDGEPILVLAGGETVLAAAISGLREVR